jgi:hypothetical protein
VKVLRGTLFRNVVRKNNPIKLMGMRVDTKRRRVYVGASFIECLHFYRAYLLAIASSVPSRRYDLGWD